MKWNESGFRPLLCTYRLNWARRTSWGWWDELDVTALQTQVLKNCPLLNLNYHWNCIWYMFHVSCICTWAELDFYSFQYACTDRVSKGRVDARRWPGAVAVMAINSSAAPAFRQYGPAFLVDFGQFYKIIQYIISYMYIYYNQSSMSPPIDVTN